MSAVRSRWAALGAAVAVTLGAGGLVSVSADSVESVFVAVTPTRVLDTRIDVGLAEVFQSGVGRKLDVTGTVGVVDPDGSVGSRLVVPDGATAIVANLTAVEPTSRGFVAIRPGSASGLPKTSSINVSAPGANVPNAVTVELPVSGPSAGRVDLFYRALDAGASTHLLLDVVGCFVADEAVPGPPGQNGVRIAEPITTTLASAGFVGDHGSVTIGPDGNPVISYRDFDNEALKVAVCTDPTCTSSTKSTIDENGFFTNTSVTLGADGNPVIAYIDDTLGDSPDLKIAVCNDPTCASSTRSTVEFDSASGVYAGTSVAIGADGNPIISFQRRTTGALVLAVCATPLCTSSTKTPVDTSAVNGGYQSSVTIGATGNPVISYYDTTNGALKVAICANPSCTASTKRTLDTFPGGGGGGTSVAIGVDGNPVISYSDSTTVDLMVVVCTNASCSASVATPVDTTGGTDSSVAIGVEGYPVISYATSNALKVAACRDPLCFSSAKTVLDPLAVGYTSLTIGADGNPFISYHDTVNSNLKVHACGNTLCSPQIRVGH